ncbi:MAG: pentapeptide repeat-containing protein [Thermodesulfobacteriota bacterium]
MPKSVRIEAVDFVNSVRSGSTDPELMERFGVSAQGLQLIFGELLRAGLLKASELRERLSSSQWWVILDISERKQRDRSGLRPVIPAKDALESIRAGMDDATLMKRYNISARGLRSLFDKLLAERIITEADYCERTRETVGTPLLDTTTPENYLRTVERESIDEEELAREIKKGTDYKVLLEKYPFSANVLQKLYGKLSRNNRNSLKPETEFRVRNRFTGATITEGSATSLGSLVERAVADKVDLSCADLSGANLSRLELTGARLIKANLSQAQLVGTDFTGANLREAKLTAADLCGAVLYKTNLAKADLSEANLTMAYAVWAFLCEANLFEANLRGADLAGANLAKSQLMHCILQDVNLAHAYTEGAIVTIDDM